MAKALKLWLVSRWNQGSEEINSINMYKYYENLDILLYNKDVL